MNQIAIVESHYLPCLAYFASVRSCATLWVDIEETYIKQTYRNRCYILGPNKIQALSVPVHRGSGKVPTKDVRIAYETRWQNNHWRSLKAAYGNTPFFAYFAEEFYDILYQDYHYLIDLNLALLSKCLELLQWKHSVEFAPPSPSPATEKRVSDYRKQILIPETRLKKHQFQPIQYTQAFGKDFVPNLSIVDVLFCAGPQADHIIKRSINQR